MHPKVQNLVPHLLFQVCIVRGLDCAIDVMPLSTLFYRYIVSVSFIDEGKRVCSEETTDKT